jgi:hypothetical protein
MRDPADTDKSVVKCRGSAHDNHILHMTVGKHGVDVGSVPPGGDG